MSISNINHEEHILVCLSSAPSNSRIIRTAARMSQAFNSRFTALFVETPDFSVASAENKLRLTDNRHLAESLGASIVTIQGDDVPYQIAEFARISGVTKIVLGRSAVTRKHPWSKPALTEQLISYIPEIDIHIIPDKNSEIAYHPKRARKKLNISIVVNTLKAAGILTGATLLSLMFHKLGFTDSNIIMVYILGVMLTSVVVSHQLYSLVTSVASVFIFNYLFTVPRFSLAAYDTGYPITFVVMFLTAYMTGTLAIRYKNQAGQSAKIAHRTNILFDTDKLLSKAKNKDDIIQVTGEQITRLLRRNIVILEQSDETLSKPYFFSSNDDASNVPFPEFNADVELVAARWAIENNHMAGATTNIVPEARYLYFLLRVHTRIYGVIGIEAQNSPLDVSEQSILFSIITEAALALENEKNAREKEEAAILAEREQLRVNLLRTISHDLRTPLTSISGNASNLMKMGAAFSEETKQQIYSDIYDDSQWLISLVENLLYATRIEEGRMSLNTSAEVLGDIIEEAMKHLTKKFVSQTISCESTDELILVKADARLIIQVITNIVDNALKYTPADSTITVSVKQTGNFAVVQIADTGNGISDKEKKKVFEKFYIGEKPIADNRRSLGLGLYLCKAIVEAHGGTIVVKDNVPHGAVFEFTLPIEEVTLYE